VGISAAERLRRTRADLEAVTAKIRSDAPPDVRPSLLQAATDLRTKVRAEKALDAYLADLNRFYAGDVEAFRKRIAAAGLELMPGVAELRRE